MTATLIDGAGIARDRLSALQKKIKASGILPGLAVILVGDDPASQIYVARKEKSCAEVGIHSLVHRLPATTSTAEVAALVQRLNRDSAIHGILVQLPLPDQVDTNAVLESVLPEKDVDGLHPANLGRLFAGRPGMVPCTPQGAMILIKSVLTNLAGLNAVVVGRSALVGRPMAQLLLQADCTVTHCHSHTRNLSDICRTADILVAAVGKPHFIRGDWIQPGAIVIDVGINRLETGKLVGDVDFDAACSLARAITPVPGGVGPMTIACLLENTARAAGI